MDIKSIHSVSKQTHTTSLFGKIEGNYLALDLKYFFPTIRTKGAQPLKGPIE
jgi:hypothetical protein